MFQRPPSLLRNFIKAPGAFREFEAEHRFIVHALRGVTADHVTYMQLGGLVVGEIDHLIQMLAQFCQQLFTPVIVRPYLNTGKDDRLIIIAVAVVEFSDVTLAQYGAELLEAAGAFRDFGGDDHLTLFAQLRAFGDMPQPVKVNIGT